MAWKQSDQWKWKKVPSTTTGGKPYFWARRSPKTGEREWVLWDRETKSWSYAAETALPEGKTWGYVPLKSKTGFKTAKAAMKYAEGSSRLSGVLDQARQHFEQAGIAPTEEEILAYIAGVREPR